MRLFLHAFGKLKTPGMREAADYYMKLARPWLAIEESELKPLPVPEKSPQTRIQIQEKEGIFLLERLGRSGKEAPGRSLVFLLDETGKSKTTLEWAQDFRKWEDTGVPSVAFCIGSSLGFSPAVRKQANGSISLGSHTVSHELARVVLLEQIYRALSVVRGHPYHNSGS